MKLRTTLVSLVLLTTGVSLAQGVKKQPKPVVKRLTADAGVSVDAGVVADVIDAGVAEPKPTMAPEVKTLVDRMQAFYEKTQDFTADFSQEYFFKTFKRKQTASGRITFKKPGMMKWEYLVPNVRTLVLAGGKVYAHDPEAKTLTRASMSTDKLSASVTFLFGQGKLADEFSISQKACPTCTGTQLELLPLKPDPRFQKVMLEIDPKTNQVIKSIVVDPDGSTNTITFLKLTTNVGVDEKIFKLTPPTGTQIQDLTQQIGAGAATSDAGVK